jgi:hypothetical protein
MQPNLLKMGPKTYTIFWDQESWQAHHDADDYGHTSHKSLIICINPNQALDQKADTLLHEILHCCIASVGNLSNYDKVPNLEEHIVTTTAPWLLGILRDNTEVLRYLLEPW